ncbi:bifunctional uridylyltransferase/uridylyl-removing enzyme [Egicoccus halophilus]|uniref:Bifunctional uridylyltransferase/uridylyl-removing enzyme n=1 Tax=Egicoccus halophilus TaxID=1670830 RepID=A0A8J3A807_9ACTN|nr:bifunctional uridylyltransferase/uridylyl-removing enzyme [Egicoccus halophilus]
MTSDHAAGTTAPGPPAATAVAAGLRRRRQELVDAGPPAGRAWCEAWSAEVDDALGRLSAPAVADHRLAVVAVGGYGRRELCPGSDLDLLILHDRLEQPALEHVVRQVVYPLWDAGMAVGYAVRDRREAIGAVDDLDTATAMLDLRTVAGDRGLVQSVHVEVLRRLRQRPHRFLTALRRADDERRRKAGDAAEALEPDLKNGAGGLRDVQSLAWAAAALVGVRGLDALVPAGYLGAADRPRLVHARERLLTARVALHLEAARTAGAALRGKHEVLRLDLQDAVARQLGYEDRDEHSLAAHELLRELFLAARTVDHVHRRAWSLIDADLARGARRRRRPTEREHDDFELVDGVLRLPAAQDLDASGLPGRLFTALADTGAVLDRSSAARLRRHVEDGRPGWHWSDPERDRFVRVLWRGGVMLSALAELDDVGVLTAMLPEWEPLRGRPQRNPYHRYSLDRHAWHAVAALGDLVRRESWAAETLRLVEDREGLLLGVLLHDVGKAVGEPHAQTGVPLARAIATRMGAAPGTIDLVARLVRLHLLLPDAARRRDVTDPELLGELADAVGDRSTLACLHLLAAADGLATGPTAWSPWTASLLHTLITKVSAVLDDQDDAATASDREREAAVATVREAQRLAPELGADAALVREHLALLPTRYARSVSPRAVVRHTLMAAHAPGATEVRTRVTPGEDLAVDDGRVDELDVVALDHPGWFAKVAGVVALHAGSILAADAFSREDGLAVDTFKVRPPEGATGAWWVAVEGDLAEAAAGKLAIRARVLRQARAVTRRSGGGNDVPTTITAQLDGAGRATLVEVRTRDRVGVLYAIATALAELELDIVVARIQTLGREVVDVFSVRDADGRPLDEDHLGELHLAVAGAIEEVAGTT